MSHKFDDLYGPSAGRVMDATPMEIPAGFRRPPTLAEQVQRLVRGALSEAASSKGLESFDEAQDFDVPDDPVDPSTPFEEFFDPVLGRSLTADEFKRFEAAYREQYLRGQADKMTAEERHAALRLHVEELARNKLNKRLRPKEGGQKDSPPPQAADVPKTP